jgi:hypothetical protein
LLDRGRRIFGAVETGIGAGDEHDAARLPDGERDAGVGADVGLLEGHGRGGVTLDQRGDLVPDAPEPGPGRVAGSRRPGAVVDDPEASAV